MLEIEGDLDREGEGLFDRMQGIGAHEVVIETPEHALSITALSEHAVEQVLWAFRDRVLDLKNDKRLRYVLLFKNQGESAGATLEHTHSQLIALPVVPKRVQEEIEGSERYYDFKERCVYCDLIRQEVESRARAWSRRRIISWCSSRTPRGFRSRPGFCRAQHRSHYEERRRRAAEESGMGAEVDAEEDWRKCWSGRRIT